MKRFLAITAVAAFALLAPMPVHAAPKLSDAKMVELQAMLQSHIDGMLVNGAMLQLNNESGAVQQLFPTKNHPKIMSTDSFLVLCADFVDANGKDVMANFYVAEDQGRYVVFHTSWGMDAALDRLMKDGKAVMAN